MPISQPCLTCRTLTSTGNRCAPCQTAWNRAHPKPERKHYAGDYKRRAKAVRANAVACHLCGGGDRGAQDPFTADHIIAGEPASPLAAAHRSCNSRRQNKPINP